jgi:hypothetical protein
VGPRVARRRCAPMPLSVYSIPTQRRYVCSLLSYVVKVWVRPLLTLSEPCLMGQRMCHVCLIPARHQWYMRAVGSIVGATGARCQRDIHADGLHFLQIGCGVLPCSWCSSCHSWCSCSGMTEVRLAAACRHKPVYYDSTSTLPAWHTTRCLPVASTMLCCRSTVIAATCTSH